MKIDITYGELDDLIEALGRRIKDYPNEPISREGTNQVRDFIDLQGKLATIREEEEKQCYYHNKLLVL